MYQCFYFLAVKHLCCEKCYIVLYILLSNWAIHLDNPPQKQSAARLTYAPAESHSLSSTFGPMGTR